MEKVVRLCRHRGFIFPSAEIYGGFRSTYDYGPLGVNMLRNVKNAWWRSMVQLRDDVVGLDAAILSPARRLGGLGPPGHLHRPAGRLPQLPRALAGRQDRRRLPQLRLDRPDRGPGVQPHVQDARRAGGGRGARGVPAARDGPGHVRQLRQRRCSTTRKRPPFGIAQVGKSFRNEITPAELRLPDPRVRADGDGVLRAARRERQKWFDYWLAERFSWYLDLGIPEDKLRLRHHDAERAVALLAGHGRRGVPVPLGLGRARGHRQPGRLRPHGARQGLGGATGVLRPADQRALRALRDRAGGRAPRGR